MNVKEILMITNYMYIRLSTFSIKLNFFKKNK